MKQNVRPLTAAVAILALGVAACGGSSGPGVASGGSATPTATAGASSSNGSAYDMELAFSRCMRAHGVLNFPDPPPGFGPGPAQIAIDTNSPRVQAALNACRPLIPPGVSIGSQHPPAQLLAQELKFSRCMRAHRIAAFPDPRQDGGLDMTGPGFNRNSPQYQRAYRACRSDLPNGGVKSPPPRNVP